MKNKFWIGFLSLILLSGCGMNQDVWVYSDESWKIKQVMEYNPSLIPDLSFDLMEGIGLKIPVGGWTEELMKLSYNQLITAYQQYGIDATLRRSRTLDGVNYQVDLSGEGFPLLEKIGLAGDMDALVAPLAAIYQVDVSQVQQMPEFQQLQQMRTVQVEKVGEDEVHLRIQQIQPVYGLKFKIHAKSITSSNSTSETGNTAEWVNPINIDVTFQPLDPINPVPYIIGTGILAALGLTGGAIALTTRARNLRPARTTSRSNFEADRIRRQQQQRRNALRRNSRR